MNQKSDSPQKNNNSFWGRQTKRDKIALVTAAVNVFVSLVLGLITVFIPDSKLSIGGRIGLLTVNIGVFIIMLQLAVGRFFDDQEDKLDSIRGDVDNINNRMYSTLEEMKSMNALGETYIKIFRQEDKVKNLYQSSLDGFLQRLRDCIDDKRSGALDTPTYYEVLTELADELILDKEPQDMNGGEIWALTFCLDNEWDDENAYERMWFSKLKSMDSDGIPTKRLWAFDKKMLDLLKKDPLDDDAEELLNRLQMYCSNSTEFPNTSSFAIMKSEIADTHIKLFGKGFFAGKFSDGKLSLIRGVCFDNLLSSNSLGGEIDFDVQRISTIRHHWQTYLKLAEPLNKFLFSKASDAAKNRMKELGYKEE